MKIFNTLLAMMSILLSADLYSRSSISIAVRNLSASPIVDGNFEWKTTHEGSSFTSNIKGMTPIQPGELKGWAWNDTWNYPSKQGGTYERTHVLVNASVIYEEKNPATGQPVKKMATIPIQLPNVTFLGRSLDFALLPGGQLKLIRVYSDKNHWVDRDFEILYQGKVKEFSNGQTIFTDGTIINSYGMVEYKTPEDKQKAMERYESYRN